MEKEEIRKLILDCGADLCGFAPVERFTDVPNEFHPKSIFDKTETVVVFAKRVPESVFHSRSAVPYTKVNLLLLEELIRIGVNVAIKLQDWNILGLPIPSEPYEYWDAENKTGKGILDLKKAGCLAGLGIIGRNTLLTNKVYGNRILLNAILVDKKIIGDEILTGYSCKNTCMLCYNSCKSKAIAENGVNQKSCREHSSIVNKKGYFLYVCNTCRIVCPIGKGF